jgi:CheY-like chemotaxis protein
VTGWGQEEDRARSREHGFDAHLTKPADVADVMRIISDATQR